MSMPPILSVDAMGGDNAPDVVVDGLSLFLSDRSGVSVLLHGDEAKLKPLIDARPALAGRCEIAHTDHYVSSEMKPSQALRRGKGTSMWNAVEAVKTGAASASVSAGNTGALMAISMLILRKMDGVHRPAMTAMWPTMKGRTAVLDVGANIEADASQLMTFAIMGEAYARAVLNKARPSVALLNIGSEDTKGHDELRGAHERLLSDVIDIDYVGFVEGDDISGGAVDVVVTDGFTGNVALKAGEGVARLVASYVREALTSGTMSKVGAVLASSGLKTLRERLNPSNVNGGVLLGLNGVSVKSHGGTDAKGFATACALAMDLAASSYMEEIAANLKRTSTTQVAAD